MRSEKPICAPPVSRKFSQRCLWNRSLRIAFCLMIAYIALFSALLSRLTYNCAPCHSMQSHICKVYACLAVTCHLHFWQNDRDLLRATAVTRGWNWYLNKSQHRKLTLEKKILPPLLQGFEPATFQSRVRRSNHWAIPAPWTGLRKMSCSQATAPGRTLVSWQTVPSLVSAGALCLGEDERYRAVSGLLIQGQRYFPTKRPLGFSV